ncbi:branched-chain amino acid aminotransferase II [Myriangium duriaei CBS 260.36]|uniref:Branched-chain amino acid aminotransferase II n=1 Tax=Myriangium duriaei CBS 260.36 TaxID=1168546 RepID=A0A9P4MSP2_9PEZI|nr:branched-chain amino acid aminotransferase II [Myriangium duriaei CBS 260.36]
MTGSFPPPPTTSIDWHNVGFKVREVNGHIESHYSKTTGQWSAPRFVRSPYLSLHGMAPGLNYGQQCYEGMKAFRGPGDQDISIFRPSKNAARMQRSAESISIPPVPTEHFLQCVRLAVGLNAEFVPPHDTGAAMYIRPLLFGSSAQLGLSPPEEYTFLVYVLPTGVYHGVNPVKALILDDFDRAAPHGTGSYKVGGNYAPVLRYSERARDQGYGITLHLDSQTRTVIDEFSTSAFLGAKKSGDQVEIVVPDSRNVIESVTAESVCDIARDLGWKVSKRPITYEELPDFEEVMAAGTAAALVPIKSITRGKDEFKYRGASDEPGPIVVELLTKLKGIQQGKIEDKHSWLDNVQLPKEGSFGREEGQGQINGVDDSVDRLP